MRGAPPILLGLASLGATCWGWVALIAWAPNDKTVAWCVLLGGIGGALACGIWLSFLMARTGAQRRPGSRRRSGPSDRPTEGPHAP